LKRSHILVSIVLLVLALDQALKVWVKTNMSYGEYFTLLDFDWARIHFVENPGMAFGATLGPSQGKIILGLFVLATIAFVIYFFKNRTKLGIPIGLVGSFLIVIALALGFGLSTSNGDYGKLALSLFRIAAVFFLIYYIGQLLQAKVHFGLLLSFALILAGALGNIIDSVIYGQIFSASYVHGPVAELFPAEGGYAGFLYGKVVDMFHFPLFKGYFPSWFPFWSGEPFEFFRPVFNLADTSISLGVINILLFQRDFFAEVEEASENKETSAISAEEENINKELIDKTTEKTIDEVGDTTTE